MRIVSGNTEVRWLRRLRFQGWNYPVPYLDCPNSLHPHFQPCESVSSLHGIDNHLHEGCIGTLHTRDKENRKYILLSHRDILREPKIIHTTVYLLVTEVVGVLVIQNYKLEQLC